MHMVSVTSSLKADRLEAYPTCPAELPAGEPIEFPQYLQKKPKNTDANPLEMCLSHLSTHGIATGTIQLPSSLGTWICPKLDRF